MAKFLLSRFIEPELEAIWDYIAIDNSEAADRFIEAAYSTIRLLAQMPGIGIERHFPKARLRGLRSFRIKDFDNYLIFYGSIPDGIEVFHIIHGARDLNEIWKEL